MFIIEMFNDTNQAWAECPFTGSFRGVDKAQDAIDALRTTEFYSDTFFRVTEKAKSSPITENGEPRKRGRPKGSKDKRPRVRRSRQELESFVEDNGSDYNDSDMYNPPPTQDEPETTEENTTKILGLDPVPYRGVEDYVPHPTDVSDLAPDSRAA